MARHKPKSHENSAAQATPPEARGALGGGTESHAAEAGGTQAHGAEAALTEAVGPGASPPGGAVQRALGYETRDARFGPMLLFVVIFLACVVGILALSWGIYAAMNGQWISEARLAMAAHPLAEPTLPAGPLLEPQPAKNQKPESELIETRDRENALIDDRAWGWIDNRHQFARIPIDAAMALAARDGIPRLLATTQPTTQPFMAPASARHGPDGVP